MCSLIEVENIMNFDDFDEQFEKLASFIFYFFLLSLFKPKQIYLIINQLPNEKRDDKITDKMGHNVRKFWKANYDYKGILKRDDRIYTYYNLHFLKMPSNFLFLKKAFYHFQKKTCQKKK